MLVKYNSSATNGGSSCYCLWYFRSADRLMCVCFCALFLLLLFLCFLLLSSSCCCCCCCCRRHCHLFYSSPLVALYIFKKVSDSTGFEGVAFSLWRENSKRQIAASCLPCLSWSLLETNGRLALLPSHKKKLRSGSQFGGHNCHLQLVETCCRSRGRRFLGEAPSLFAKKHEVMWTTWEKLWC